MHSPGSHGRSRWRWLDYAPCFRCHWTLGLQILIFNLAVLLGATAQGLTGFGSGTLTLSVLVMFFSFKDVLPIVALAALATNIVLGLLSRREFDWRRGPIAAAGLAVGVIVGAQLLTVLPVDILQRALGAAILCYVAINLFKTPAPRAMPRLGWGDASGLGASALFSGVIVGAVGVSPVPLLIYTNMRYPKQFSRSILTMSFIVGSTVQAIVYTQLGVLTPAHWLMALAVLPAVMIGLGIGHRLHYRVDQKTFSRVLAVLLVVPALRLISS